MAPREYVCTDCGQTVHYLEVFPGPRCLACYRPIGEAQMANMTGRDLARMWGGR
jgi:DNA-directed RNA polymerase subunit RPC12/RpoP